MSSAFFKTVMDSERTALITEQRLFGMPCFSAVQDIATVRDVPRDKRALHPVNIEALGATSFVQSCPTLGYRFLWVHVANDDYRKDYTQHLARWFGAAAPTIPSDLHVDHLFSRKRARLLDLVYIRMILLPRSINTSHGAGYERMRTSDFGTPGRPRKIDTVMLMKLFGFPSPPADGQVTPEITRFEALMKTMLCEDHASFRNEIANLLNVAKRSRR